MKLFIKLLILVAVLSGARQTAKAQNTEEALAAQYYQNQEFDKALDLYRKLFKNNEQSVYYYEYYFQCLLQTKNFQEAEKTLKRLSKKSNAAYHYVVDYAFLNQIQDNPSEAEKQYAQIIKSLPENEIAVEQMANAFIKRGLEAQALLVFEQGNKWFSTRLPYSEKLIPLYYTGKDYKKMIVACLEFLRTQPTSYVWVQNQLSRLIEQDIEKEYLRERMLMYQQKNSEFVPYGDLVVWMFEQYREYKTALRQAIALDKREKSDGARIFNLAATCIAQEAYEVAVSCYRYIIEQGESHINYMRARNGLLDVQYARVTNNPQHTQTDLESLIADYLEYLNLYGKNWNNADAMRRLSQIYLFYSHESDKAITLMEELINLKGVHPLLMADVKLTLGDAYLVSGDIWEAQLLYGQVDKDFKEEPLGQEARFRNARLSYYNGDFEWAKDQLEVLKTATSQFISNNAIELSLRIQDNTGLDSSEAAMLDYAKADLLFFQNKLDACMVLLTELPFKYPGHSLQDDIAYLKGQVMEQKRNYDEAILFYERVVKNHGDDILADNALFRLAFLHQYVKNNKEEALKYYERIIVDYTGSLFVIESRKQYIKLKAEIGSGS